MREVSDAYLLTIAEVSATLIGLFLVGAFFYADTGLRRLGPARAAFEPYLRAGIRITLIVFAIPLVLSISVVTMELTWSRFLFVVLSGAVLLANIDTLRRLPAAWAATRSVALVSMEIVTTGGVIALVIIPWALGGLEPTREDLNWAIVIALGAGFLSVSATILSVFDLAAVSLEHPHLTSGDPAAKPAPKRPSERPSSSVPKGRSPSSRSRERS